MSEDAHDCIPASDAKFLGWQQTVSGGRIALYVITAPNHPAHGSTVSERGLHKLDLEIPATPVREGIFFGRQEYRGSGDPGDEKGT
jgi:hypothetical protein